MRAPGTTVCIVPRERFSAAVQVLETVVADPERPARIACYDGGSPPDVRDGLARLAREHDVTLLRSEAFAAPNAARNALFARVDTEYTAFLDNDTFPSPGWAPRLEACAEETGAAVVAPMYGFAVDDPATAVVHLAGAENHFSGERPLRRHHMEFFHENEDPEEVRRAVGRTPTEQAEGHLLFARTSALEAVGPLDEGLLSFHEHLDVCLRIMDQGGTIWLEPEVLATFLKSTHLTLADRRSILLRWSHQWNRATLERFCTEWGVDRNERAVVALTRAVEYMRIPAYRPWRSPIGRLKGMVGRPSLPLPDHTIGRAVARYEERRRRRAPAAKVVHLASWDRER
jgi:GT2 family glycosyltransferase